MSEEMKLEVCPFCGGNPELQNDYEMYSVYCEDCGVMQQEGNKEYAIKAWNKRSEGATTPKQPDNSEALRELDDVIKDFKFNCERLKPRISVVARNVGLMLEGEVDKLTKIRALIGGEGE